MILKYLVPVKLSIGILGHTEWMVRGHREGLPHARISKHKFQVMRKGMEMKPKVTQSPLGLREN